MIIKYGKSNEQGYRFYGKIEKYNSFSRFFVTGIELRKMKIRKLEICEKE